MIKQELHNKYNSLKEILSSYNGVAVGYSGGVDSTFLLYVAKEVLGENVIALTSKSVFCPETEIEETKSFCKELGVNHVLIENDVLSIKGVKENPTNRCYLCKKSIFDSFLQIAQKEGMDVVIEGSNLDDDGDYRPGRQALSELNIKSPLKEAGLTKQDIRDLSQYFGVYTWNKPSFACLASRIPYGEIITEEKLSKIEMAENYLHEQGFLQCRVRVHQENARIEVLESDFSRLMDIKCREAIYNRLKEIGFVYISIDLKGYRTGSLNEVMNKSL